MEELQDSKSRLEADISELEDSKQELVDDTEAEKERMRESLTGVCVLGGGKGGLRGVCVSGLRGLCVSV